MLCANTFAKTALTIKILLLYRYSLTDITSSYKDNNRSEVPRSAIEFSFANFPHGLAVP